MPGPGRQARHKPCCEALHLRSQHTAVRRAQCPTGNQSAPKRQGRCSRAPACGGLLARGSSKALGGSGCSSGIKFMPTAHHRHGWHFRDATVGQTANWAATGTAGSAACPAVPLLAGHGSKRCAPHGSAPSPSASAHSLRQLLNALMSARLPTMSSVWRVESHSSTIRGTRVCGTWAGKRGETG